MNCLSFPLPSFPSRLRVSRRRGRRPSDYWTGEGRNLTQFRSTKSTAPKSAAFSRDFSASSLDGVKIHSLRGRFSQRSSPRPYKRRLKCKGERNMKSQRGFIFLAPLAALACWAPPFKAPSFLPGLRFFVGWRRREGGKGGLT